MSLGERPRGSARPTPNEHYNSLPSTSIEGALASQTLPTDVYDASYHSPAHALSTGELPKNSVNAKFAEIVLGELPRTPLRRSSYSGDSRKFASGSPKSSRGSTTNGIDSSPIHRCLLSLPQIVAGPYTQESGR